VPLLTAQHTLDQVPPHLRSVKRRVAKRSPLLLMASLLALGSSVGAAGGKSRADQGRWTIRAERLIGRLPVSASVAERGRLVYAHAGNVPRPPASDEKLVLSMALLDRFGAHYRIATTVEGPHPANRSVRGNLWLVGHGDPELNDAALARLARKLRTRGIRAVRGSVIGVTNTFTRERWAPGWQPIALQFTALPTALVFDANTSLWVPKTPIPMASFYPTASGGD
jgi:D-alanyl-D-alanine carboxypeptidase